MRYSSSIKSIKANSPAPSNTERKSKTSSSDPACRKTERYNPLMYKASICTAIKAQIPSDKVRKCCSSVDGSKRTAKASSIAKHNTTKSKHIKNAALTLRGKSAKDFSIKLGDTKFNAAM